MQKTIINRSKATRTLTYLGVKIALGIGANEVDDAWADAALKDPYFNACRKRGIFRVDTPPAPADEIEFEPGDTVIDLRLLKVHEAIKAVKECDSTAQLEQWLHQDGRKLVRDAILKRGVALMPKAEKEPEETPVIGGDA